MNENEELLQGLTKSRIIIGWQLTNLLAGFLLFLGAAGWFGGLIFLGVANNISFNSLEMPLGDLDGIVVDSLGRIYCRLGFYGRIQQYDQEGKFIRGWQVEAGGGLFKMRINEQDEVEVVTARTDTFFRYDSTGKLLEKFRSTERVEELFRTFHMLDRVNVEDGILIARNRLMMFPTVIKVRDNGESSPLISVPIHKWVLMGPLPAWLFFGSGLLLLRWKQKQLQPVNSLKESFSLHALREAMSKPQQEPIDTRSYIDKLRGHRK